MKLRVMLAGAIVGALGIALIAALLGVPHDPNGPIPGLVAEALAGREEDNPVTAVLLEFRAYDTLLEVAVLLVAAVGGMSERVAARAAPGERWSEPLVQALVRWLVPFMVLTAGYLIWAGTLRAGGAFQAGAVLAGAGVLLRLAGRAEPWLAPSLTLRLGLVLGLAVFLASSLLAALLGAAFLGYPEPWTKTFILGIEIAVALSIGIILLSLFAASPAAEQAYRS